MCACVCTHVRTAVVGEHDCVHKHLYHLATTVTGTKARMSDLQQKTMEARTRKGLIQERLWSVRLQRIKTQVYSQETGQRNDSEKVYLLDVGPQITCEPYSSDCLCACVPNKLYVVMCEGMWEQKPSRRKKFCLTHVMSEQGIISTDGFR